MKKYLSIMFVAVVAMVAFSACSKDEDDNNPLVGTSWYSENVYSAIYSSTAGEKYYQVFRFKSNTTFDAYYENARTGEIGDAGFQPDINYKYSAEAIHFGDDFKNVLYFVSPTKLSNHKDTSEPYTIIFNKRIK